VGDPEWDKAWEEPSTPENWSIASSGADLCCVAFFEKVHYLGDPGRGSVWEETIINCPPHIRLLAMSATIANAQDLGGWISQVPSDFSCGIFQACSHTNALPCNA